MLYFCHYGVGVTISTPLAIHIPLVQPTWIRLAGTAFLHLHPATHGFVPHCVCVCARPPACARACARACVRVCVCVCVGLSFFQHGDLHAQYNQLVIFVTSAGCSEQVCLGNFLSFCRLDIANVQPCIGL